jgi:hypothetical protein
MAYDDPCRKIFRKFPPLPMLLDLDKPQSGGPAVEALKPSHDAAVFAERLTNASPPEIVAAARALPGPLRSPAK